MVRSAGVEPVELVRCARTAPTPRYFLGSGKVDTIDALVRSQSIEVVLFNHALSPSQERNLEKVWCCKVLDRTGLILDIFAQRARSHAGKLQVELAQLQHLSTRLVRGWTHLERQKGGIGLRGPGESQLETDRRLLRERIKWIQQRLAKVNRQRQQGRRSRHRADLPTVALVGYTNAGKSTLFNSLTDAKVYAADQLFATLDPTLRAIELAGLGKVVLADTVGFVRQLPHKLVEAFKATLEEAAEADLLLHIVDAAADDIEANIAAVDAVLAEIGAADTPTILVMNKIDLVPGVVARYDDGDGRREQKVWLSAAKREGFDGLRSAIAAQLGGQAWSGIVSLPAGNGRLRAQFYQLGAVLDESVTDSGDSELTLRLPHRELDRLLAADDIVGAVAIEERRYS